jgi:ABC-type sugar transport system substrate-binding protein
VRQQREQRQLLLGRPVGVRSAAATCEGKKIAFVMGAESDPFFQAMKVGATEATAAAVPS